MKKFGWSSILVAAMLLAVAVLAEAQQPGKVPRIGLLIPGSQSAFSMRTEAFRQGLRDLGYVEGKNISIEYRYAEEKMDRLPDLAAELVRLKVDVIVTVSTGTRAAKQATSAIPIVFAAVTDPVRTGLVAGLARPGGNVTGLTNLSEDLDGKRLELLTETVPNITRVAHLWNPESPKSGMQAAAQTLGLQLQSLQVRSANEFDKAFEVALGGGAQALIVSPSPLFITHRQRLVELATKTRLPAIYPFGESVDAGGLMSYTSEFAANFRRAATYVDKILKGTKPGDLPVEQPKKVEFIINLKTAKQIGVTIPPNVLAQADRVIK